MNYQELSTQVNSPQDTGYNSRNAHKDPMDDPNYMPPELLEMQDPENGLVLRSLNPKVTPNTGKMILMCTKKEDLYPGCKEPVFMIGPECNIIFKYF